jgi:hypothetical protein
MRKPPRLQAPSRLLAVLLAQACGSGSGDPTGGATDSGTATGTATDTTSSVPTTTAPDTDPTDETDGTASPGTDSVDTTAATDTTFVPTTGPADCDPALDRDDDGLADAGECAIGTDPLDPDSDDDGLLDGPELDNQTDPLDPDTDDDGLLDGPELEGQTDPLDPDTDDDGLLDGLELDNQTDPLDPDTDDDGLTDQQEVTYPQVCVAADLAAQRRDDATGLAPACTADADCLAGETCDGLDPLDPDSDDDTLLDGAEDTDHDGTLDADQGETDPRLFDTDGDGSSDADSGVALCKPDAQLTPPILALPGEPIQLAHDPAFTAVATVTAARSAALLDDPLAEVSALVTTHAAAPAGDIQTDRIAIEAELRAALLAAGASSIEVFVSRRFTSHELHPAVTSTYRVLKPATSASALRDALVTPLTGAAAPGDQSVGADPGDRYFLDVTVVRRSDTTAAVAITLTPETAYDDGTTATAIRLGDLVNASGISAADTPLDDGCQGADADAAPPLVDMLWLIDVSTSTDDDQDRFAAACAPLLTRMAAAGVDLRSGFFNASHGSFNMPTPQPGWPLGFAFEPGTDPAAAHVCARRVTRVAYTGPGGDNPNLAPYAPTPQVGNNEEPIAAGVVLHEQLAQGDADPEHAWRPDARKVMFAFTDEPAADVPTDANDWLRYFITAVDPDTGQPFAPGGTYGAAVLQAIVDHYAARDILLFGNVTPLKAGRTCNDSDARDLPHCVIERSGHGVSDNTSTAADALAGLLRVGDAIVGEVSPYRLPRTPISATLRVNVDGVDVPRSKLSGFDYDLAARALVFHGDTYRPQPGQILYVAYRTWDGSPG